MGIFTDESHTEYVQADPSKPVTKSREYIEEKERLTEAMVRKDLRRYTTKIGGGWFIVWIITTMFLVVGAVASCRVEAPMPVILPLFGTALLVHLIFAIYKANLFGWFRPIASRKALLRKKSPTVHIYKETLTNFRYKQDRSCLIAMLHFGERQVCLTSDRVLFPWSKSYRCRLSSFVETLCIGEEYYVATWSDGLGYRMVYPCCWFVLGEVSQEESL